VSGKRPGPSPSYDLLKNQGFAPDASDRRAAILRRSRASADYWLAMTSAEPFRRIGHPAFRQQIFDVAQAEREPEVEPNSLVYDLRRETIPSVADFLHRLARLHVRLR
jgi:hypothetical protein